MTSSNKPNLMMLCIKSSIKPAANVLAILLFLTACDTKTAKDYLYEADKLSEQGKYKGAIKLLDKAISKDHRYSGAYINRGADKSALGDYNDAIEGYKAVLNYQLGNKDAEEELSNYCTQ